MSVKSSLPTGEIILSVTREFARHNKHSLLLKCNAIFTGGRGAEVNEEFVKSRFKLFSCLLANTNLVLLNALFRRLVCTPSIRFLM